MFGIGATELLVISLIALLLFGNRLPTTMRSLGQSVRAFREGTREGDEARIEEQPVSAAAPAIRN